jgi:hypothetical protein
MSWEDDYEGMYNLKKGIEKEQEFREYLNYFLMNYSKKKQELTLDEMYKIKENIEREKKILKILEELKKHKDLIVIIEESKDEERIKAIVLRMATEYFREVTFLTEEEASKKDENSAPWGTHILYVSNSDPKYAPMLSTRKKIFYIFTEATIPKKHYRHLTPEQVISGEWIKEEEKFFKSTPCDYELPKI